MTCTCIGADDILGVLAHLVADFFGQVTLGWVLTSFPRPSHITLALAAVTITVACTGFPVVGLAYPLMALTQWTEVGARFGHVTDADPHSHRPRSWHRALPGGCPGARHLRSDSARDSLQGAPDRLLRDGKKL